MRESQKNEKFIIRAYGATDIGQRKNNEDAFLVDEDSGLFIVADGMGGHDRGEVASWFTTENLTKIVSKAGTKQSLEHTMDPVSEAEFIKLLKYGIAEINRKLYEQNEEILKQELKLETDPVGVELAKMRAAKKKMGTTLVSLLISGGKGYLANIGDSRAYRIEGKTITQLTHDHSWVAEQVRAGMIGARAAKKHKRRNVITRSVGAKEKAIPDIDVVSLYPPERFLLCSDGLCNVVKKAELFKFAGMPDLKTACDSMVAEAVNRGGRDNITAILIDVATSKRAELEKSPERRFFGDTMPHG